MTIKAIRIHKNNIISDKNDREVRILILLLALYTSSVIIGSAFNIKLDEYNLTDILFNITDKSFFEILNESIAYNFIIFLLIFITGFNCIGMPVTILFTICHGLISGFIPGCLFKNELLSGFGYYISCYLFTAAINSISVVIMAVFSINLSSDIMRISSGRNINEHLEIKIYLKQFMIFLCIIISAGILKSALMLLFKNIF